MSLDMAQFHQVFFEESLENLDLMEQSLLGLEGRSPEAETINAIFRAAHSIKGGSGTFGFSELSEFTHLLETLLDQVREGRRELDAESVELLLQSCDCLRQMVASLQAGAAVDATAAAPLAAAFEKLLAAPAHSEPQSELLAASVASMLQDSGGDSAAHPASERTAGWSLYFAPEPQVLQTGNEPLRIFRELAGLGELTVQALTDGLPSFDSLSVDECHLAWRLTLRGDIEREQIMEAFEWVLDECELEVTPLSNAPAETQPTPPQSAPDPKPAPAESVQPPQPAPAPPGATPATALPPSEAAAPAKTATSSSIRVGIDKVDSLINLVGELVITQSMLSELGNNFDMSKLDQLTDGLEQMLQNTKELQESVMRIRMLPISFAFNRFPRMVRDLSAKMGKQVELRLEGEQTELDKTVMERISDPLTHLVRNALDHGIETAAERRERGKTEIGVIHLNAYHQGGNIVIEVRDDGRGLDTEKILAKARSKGIVGEGAALSEQAIYELIFAPGFSTAESVSDISGRGVGMDVVQRNIQSLGGRIEVDSCAGAGTTIKVHLPLTLAILDGQLIKVGAETYIIPLITIVESLQIKREQLNRVSGNIVLYRLRDENVPIIPLYREFGIEPETEQLEEALLVVVEGEGMKVGLLVDDLLAQQQIVIKSLEQNYQSVEGISGATILGDGSVALILDVPGLIKRVAGRSRKEAA